MLKGLIEAVVLSQGNEVLTGQTVDTNANWLNTRLWELGVPVRRTIGAPDRLDDLVQIVSEARGLAPIVMCTGGLGPTRDDLTAEAVCQATGRPLELNEEAMAQVEAIFARWGRPLNDANRKQAWLPRGARVLENRWGTAPGFVVDEPGCSLYFMPGVPREMKPMFDTWVAPDLIARLELRPPRLHTIRVMGVPEAELELKMRGLERPGLDIGFRTKLPENQIKLIFAPEVEEAERQRTVAEARARVGPAAFGVDCGDLAEVVGQAMAERGQSVALAESCTSGRLCAWLGAVPGASRYLLEGAVVYSNEAKIRTAGVPAELIAEHGAVSEPVARALAEGMRARAGATWGLGITGIAGPGGGSPEKPVGTVHLSVAGPSGTEHRLVRLPGDRDRITSLAAAAALSMLWRAMGELAAQGT